MHSGMNNRPLPALSAVRGFTLPELVIVIAITGIIAAAISVFIAGPIRGYVDQSERAELVDAGEMALRRMARDIRRALPNSIRIGGGNQSIQMINTVDGARYRDGAPGNQDRRLRFNAADDQFNLLGRFNLTGAFSGNVLRLVIYHTGQAGADAYAGDPVITPAGMTITVADDAGAGAIPDEHHVALAAVHQFPFQSATQRIFLVDNAVTYLCSGGQLQRAVSAIGPMPGAGELMAQYITGCDFRYDAGTASRAGLITLQLTLTRDGESVTLLHQVHVDNAP